MSNNAQNFLTIQKGAFFALVLPQNVAKVESALAKLEKPTKRDPFKRSRYDNARTFPVYKPGDSVGEYIAKYESLNGHGLTKVYGATSCANYYAPASEYLPGVPLCVEDANPDYNPADDIAPAKTKRVNKQAARIAELEAALRAIVEDWEYCGSPGLDGVIGVKHLKAARALIGG